MARALVNKSVEWELYEPELLLEFEYDRYGDRHSKPRKFRAVWTHELAQDLQAYHAIDAEAELEAFLAEELRREIDRKMLNRILNENDINHE